MWRREECLAKRRASKLPLPKQGSGTCPQDADRGVNAGSQSRVDTVESILVEKGTKKRVWGDSDGECPEKENVRQVRRGSPRIGR